MEDKKPFWKDMINKYQESQNPENIKAKLMSDIEIEKLRAEKDKLMAERRKAKQSTWSVGDFKIGEK